MAKPLVTVICLCYNHERFIRVAVESVLKQTYSPIQIIVWDDASMDASPAVIQALKTEYGQLEIFLSTKNEGNCRAFNRAYEIAHGEFIIDFATDDVMDERRVEKQVAFFESLPEGTGLVFTDATYINENGMVLRHHYEHLFRHGLIKTVPTGDVFRDVITTYYIASPTMMMHRAVLDRLGGYDEQLAYEDFDLWVRSARDFQYAFLNERLTLIRRSATAMSSRWYRKGDRQLLSTYTVCLKALSLCRNAAERYAVSRRVAYELKHSALSENLREGVLFWELLTSIRSPKFSDRFWHFVLLLRVPLSFFRTAYHRIRYGE